MISCFNAFQRAAIACAFVALPMIGCNTPQVPKAIAEVRSPNGQWIAVERREQGGGFGTDYQETTIELRRASGSESSAIEILSFSDQSSNVQFNMQWDSPTHLTVVFTDRSTIDFQAIKCADVEISVRQTQ